MVTTGRLYADRSANVECYGLVVPTVAQSIGLTGAGPATTRTRSCSPPTTNASGATSRGMTWSGQSCYQTARTVRPGRRTCGPPGCWPPTASGFGLLSSCPMIASPPILALDTPCVLWTGYLGLDGYGQRTVRGVRAAPIVWPTKKSTALSRVGGGSTTPATTWPPRLASVRGARRVCTAVASTCPTFAPPRQERIRRPRRSRLAARTSERRNALRAIRIRAPTA